MTRILGVVGVLVFMVPLAARGQSWTPEQQEVWDFVVESWEADTSEDIEWVDRMVHPNFRGWDAGLPMPRDRDTQRRWSRYGDESGTTLIYSVFPVSIVVQGNTAVALYYGSIANEDLKGERETTHFKEVDVLIRENGEWKFLSWMGADEPNPGG
jgi:hypothetical protein